MSVRGFPERLNWRGMVHPESGWRHSPGWSPELNKKGGNEVRALLSPASWLWLSVASPSQFCHSTFPAMADILFLQLWAKINCSLFKLILSGIFFHSNTEITNISCLNRPLWGYSIPNQASTMRNLLRTILVSLCFSVPCPSALRNSSQFFECL